MLINSLRRTPHKVVILFVSIIATESMVTTTTKKDSIEDIISFWQDNIRKLDLGTNKDVIIYVGMTGSGKTAAALLVANEELESIECPKDSGLFIIRDKNGKVGWNNSISSQTTIPDLILDRDREDAVYFDCPGFQDNRGTKYDITAIDSIRRLLMFSRSLKFVFAIDHDQVQPGTAKVPFLALLRHVHDMIKDISKYSSGISLIITKTRHDFKYQNGTSVWKDDNEQASVVRAFLRSARDDLANPNSLKAPDTNMTMADIRAINDENFIKESIAFIDILLQPERIGIFRRPNETGLLSDMPHFRSQQTFLRKIIHDQLSYVNKSDSDFGFSFSEETKNSVMEILNELQNQVISNILTIGQRIEEYYKMQAGIEDMALVSLYDDVLLLSDALRLTYNTKLYLFVKQFVNVMNGTRIATIARHVESLHLNYNFIDFILNITGKPMDSHFIEVTLNQTIKNVAENNLNFLFDAIETRLAYQVRLSCSEIESFISNERINSDLIEMSDIMHTIYTHLDRTKQSSPMDFLLRFMNASWQYDVSIENAMDVVKVANFINGQIDRQLKHPIVITNKLENVIVTVKRLKEWYSFIITIYEKLTRSDLAKRKIPYKDIVGNATMLMQKCLNVKENETVTIAALGLVDFLIDMEIDHSAIQGMTVDHIELHPLIEILKRIFFTNIVCKNYENVTIITGYVIKLSDVVNQSSCWNAYREINIFALDKVIFDHDILLKSAYKEPMQLSIISPMWIVFEKTLVHLIGRDGDGHHEPMASNGTNASRNGVHGKPGLPGFQGGNFFSIASEFIDWAHLSFNLGGGNAGPAQHGGYGFDSEDGAEVEIPNKMDVGEDNTLIAVPLLWNGRFKWKLDKYEGDWEHARVFWHVWGADPSPAGNGGDGGSGGLCGEKGRISITSLDQTPPQISFDDIIVEQHQGDGGNGGRKAKKGEFHTTYYFKWKRKHYAELRDKKSYEQGYGEPGQNGRRGKNTEGISNATLTDISNRQHLVNQYKNYVRSELAKNDVRALAIRRFLNKMETDSKVQEMYDVHGFVEDLYYLENQYNHLWNNLTFIPFWQVFLDRIALHVERNINIDITQIKVLSFLWTTALSKICAINQRMKGETIVNVDEYLNSIQNAITRLYEIGTQQTIKNYQTDYNRTLTEKIESSKQFVEGQLLPEIDDILHNTNIKLIDLVNENIAQQNETEKDIDKEKKRRRALQDNMLWHSLLFPVKLVGNFIGFLGPIGNGVGGAVGGIASMAEGMLIDKDAYGGNKIKELNPLFEKTINKITNDFNNDILLLKEQLCDIEEKLKDFQPNELPKIRLKIAETLHEMDKLMGNGLEFDAAAASRVRRARQDVLDAIYKEERDFGRGDNSNSKQFFDFAKNALKVHGTTVEFYKTLKNDKGQLQQVSQAIESLEKKLELLEKHKQAIYKVMMPKIAAIRDTFSAAAQWDGKSHFELDIGKWQIQSSLRDMKLFFKQMTTGFSVQDDLLRCIEKLEEAMVAMINIYDRIDTYADDAMLAAYIADIESSSAKEITIRDPKLKAAIIDLQHIIQSNIVFEHYESALNSFKPHYFPFAHLFLNEFDLPPTLQSNDTQMVTSAAIERIHGMKRKISEAKYQIGKYDKYRKSNVVFDSETLNSQPFYRWNHSVFAKEIMELFQGKKVSILANIANGIDQNAIKFKEIGVKFRMSNTTQENKLIEVLNGFQITMSMVSDNYFRCGGIVVSMPVSDKVVIQYNLLRDKEGNPTLPNDVYLKIRENNYFLSPYAMWNLQLSPVDIGRTFSMLENFKHNDIDLELVGVGQYISKHTIEEEICTERLNEFYNSSP